MANEERIEQPEELTQDEPRRKRFITLSTPSNIDSAVIVGVSNTHTEAITIALSDEESNELSEIEIEAGAFKTITKAPSDTISGGTDGQLVAAGLYTMEDIANIDQ